MAKKEEKVVEEIQPTEAKVVEQPKQTEEVVKEGGDMKMKAPKSPKKFQKSEEQSIAKVDLSKVKEENITKDGNVTKVDLRKEEQKEKPVEEKVVEEIKEEATPVEKTEVEDTPVIEEITDEEVEQKLEETKEEVVEAIEQSEETGEPLPENIQKVVDFMKDTGGSLEDYVKLNQDYASYDDNQLVKEYLKQTKPHLSDEEVSFVMKDLYSYDEEIDEEIEVKRKKLALKEQVANAKNHLDGQKSKYYEEIKAGSKLTPDQQKAVDFFNRYNEESKQSSKAAEEQRSVFQTKTNDLFDKEFKGFEFNVGEKRYRYNVKNADKVKESQSDINNFASKFLDKKNKLVDPKGYHKALYTAMNPDAVANHFYQQGKADAIKDSMAKAKNVDMSPRQTHSSVTEIGGMKVKAISGTDSRQLRVKMNRK